MKKVLFIIVSIFIISGYKTVRASAGIPPAHPTHYMYTPAPNVNPPWSLIVSLHELSFSFPYNLQLQASLLDNIGRINTGVKFGLLDNLSLGAGLAHTLVHIGRGSHGIPNHAQPRFGMFLAWGALSTGTVDFNFVPHTQIGNHFSVGGDVCLNFRFNPLWSIMWETGTSVDMTDKLLYMNTNAGIRINPTTIKFLHFDLGVDIEEFPVSDNADFSATVFFDVIFGMVVK